MPLKWEADATMATRRLLMPDGESDPVQRTVPGVRQATLIYALTLVLAAGALSASAGEKVTETGGLREELTVIRGRIEKAVAEGKDVYAHVPFAGKRSRTTTEAT